MLRQLLTSLLVFGLLLGLSAPVFAQEPDDLGDTDGGEALTDDAPTGSEQSYEELTSQAQALFEEGQYDASIELLLRAYKLKENSNILYNVARIYEEKGALPEALDYYEQFVVAPNVDLNYRKEALERIKTIREILQIKDEKSEGGKVEEPTPQPEPAPKESSPWVGVGIGMAVVGGVAIVTGGVFGILAQGAETDFKDATDLDQARGFADDASTYATVADGLIIGGAVVGIAGILVAVLSGESESGSASGLRVDPVFGRSSVGASLSFDF